MLQTNICTNHYMRVMIVKNYSIIITCMQQIDKENLINFGERVRKLRTDKSPSLNKLTFSKGGVTSATLSRIENGLVDFKFSTLIRLVQTLDISLSDLFKDYEFKFPTED